jgi:cytochrome c
MKRYWLTFTLPALVLTHSPSSWSLDEKAARNLAKTNNCFRCHAVEREKNGPSWSSIGAKYKLKADGETKLMTHLTSAPKIKLLEEGTEEEHKIAKFRDKSELQNLVQWILSL